MDENISKNRYWPNPPTKLNTTMKSHSPNIVNSSPQSINLELKD